LLKSLLKTTNHPDDVEIVLRFDDDDIPTQRELGIFVRLWKNIRFVQMGQPEFSGKCWNDCATAASGEIFMVCGDDIVFRTADWDTKVGAAFDKYPDKIVSVYGNDTVFDQKLGTHPFIHRNWFNVVGRLSQDDYIYWWDTWIQHVAQALQRIEYLPSVVIEHMHFSNNKAPMDETYEHNRRLLDTEIHKFYSFEEGQRRGKDVEKLQQFIDNYANTIKS